MRSKLSLAILISTIPLLVYADPYSFEVRNRVLELITKGDYSEAKKLVISSVSSPSQNIKAGSDLLVILLRVEAFNESEVLATKLLSEFPEDAAIRFYLAMSLFGQQRYSEAATKFELALKSNPQDGDSCKYLSICYAFLGDLEKSEMFIKRYEAMPKRTERQ